MTPPPAPTRIPWLTLVGVAIVGLLAFAAIARAMITHAQRDALMRADPDTILTQPQMADFALTLGRSVYIDHCSNCHGKAGEPNHEMGVPDLTDSDYLYGIGRVSEIETIILHGIRAGDDKGWNLAAMPAYGHEKPYAREPLPSLTPGEIRDVAQYLATAIRGSGEPAATQRGRNIYLLKGGCFDCHGQDRRGDSAIGAPDLIDAVALYGDNSQEALVRSITGGRAGTSPAFARFISPVEARAVAVYVGSLNPHNRKRTR